MGCPIETFICASNENNVLTEFIQTGIYNAKRVFKKTNSPSMDIVISSNLERLLYLYCKDDSLVTQMMNDLQETESYELTSDMKTRLQNEFFASYTTQVETKELIKAATQIKEFVNKSFDEINISIKDIKNRCIYEIKKESLYI